MEAIHKVVELKNEIRVVLENIEHVKSFSVGVWVGTGSAMELAEENGVSHYLEHMFFKGTHKRTAKQIAESIDNIGGQLNAMTSKEYTCFYAKVLNTHADIAIDVLSDMLLNSKLSPEDMELERKVISEEISMGEDTPEELIHDLISKVIWQEKALGFPIAGTSESLSCISHEMLIDYFKRQYTPNNTVISVVGNFEEDKILKMLEEKFGSWKNESIANTLQDRIEVSKGILTQKKDIEQCHICIALEGYDRLNENLYDLLVVNSVFGGGMSSRLFQKVREEAGLAYSVYSYVNSYRENGTFVIYAGLNSNNLIQAIKLINEEIITLKRYKISESELSMTKEQIKAGLIMSLESMSSRMSNMGKGVLLYNKVKTIDDVMELVDAVTVDSVSKTIERVFDINKLNIALVGNFEDRDYLEIMDF